MVNDRDFKTMDERLGLLDGTRGTDTNARAVRIGDVTPALEFPPAPQAKRSVAAPTKAEFDVLVADVQLLYKKLAALSEALRLRKTL